MTEQFAWSVGLSALGVVGLWIAGQGGKAGWALGLAAQWLWVVFALRTGQYGFLLSAAAYGTVYARNLWRWHRQEQARARGPQNGAQGPAAAPWTGRPSAAERRALLEAAGRLTAQATFGQDGFTKQPRHRGDRT